MRAGVSRRREGEWIEANQWPLPQTRWTPFYLHEHGLLSEHEFWAGEAPTVYVDSPYERGSAAVSHRR